MPLLYSASQPGVVAANVWRRGLMHLVQRSSFEPQHSWRLPLVFRCTSRLVKRWFAKRKPNRRSSIVVPFRTTIKMLLLRVLAIAMSRLKNASISFGTRSWLRCPSLRRIPLISESLGRTPLSSRSNRHYHRVTIHGYGIERRPDDG